MGLTLLAHASLPLKCWDEAFSTAMFLNNRLPSKVINNETHYERLLGRQPDYSFLRTILGSYSSDQNNVYFLGIVIYIKASNVLIQKKAVSTSLVM